MQLSLQPQQHPSISRLFAHCSSIRPLPPLTPLLIHSALFQELPHRSQNPVRVARRQGRRARQGGEGEGEGASKPGTLPRHRLTCRPCQTRNTRLPARVGMRQQAAGRLAAWQQGAGGGGSVGEVVTAGVPPGVGQKSSASLLQRMAQASVRMILQAAMLI